MSLDRALAQGHHLGRAGRAAQLPQGGQPVHARHQRLWDFSVPAGVVALAPAGITVAAVPAAAWPARRAARTGMTAAIAVE
ncbi:hypothetical protein [Streptomyces sp. NPDC017529]|uniref:hypothetical protein n=1 Tax=Streptomyces sp. NPDC017529 TaxID=3365000 RepID=UPI0037AE8358